MACYHPAAAFQTADGGVVFSQLKRHDIIGDIKLPCGQCVGCRIDRSREWSIRCLHEAKMWTHNSFITLTYNEENLPANKSLNYRDYQLFMKRLRFKTGYPIRFFMCGEYGEKDFRPHYHALLFGYQFPDLLYWGKSPAGHPVYRSKILEELWTLGNSLIGNVSRESAGYVARYCMKKVTGDLAESHYAYTDENGNTYQRTPEFARMSLKPGIGATWYQKYHSDVLPNDYVIADGIKMPVPRYYENMFKSGKGDLDEIKYNRALYAAKHAANRTPDRLAAREEVQKRRIQSLERKI